MIGTIKNLLTGILSFFVGLFGGKKAEAGKLNPATNKPKKRSGYFMELDESEDNNSLLNKIDPAGVVKQVQQTANTVATQAKETVSNATAQVQETANKVTGQAKETTKTATEQAKETVKSAKPVAAAKSAKETTKTAEPAAQPKSKVELVQTAEGLKAEPIKNEPSVVAGSNGQSKTDTTFAPKYLNPATASSSRRRPGANMSSFLDMANQVKPAKS